MLKRMAKNLSHRNLNQRMSDENFHNNYRKVKMVWQLWLLHNTEITDEELATNEAVDAVIQLSEYTFSAGTGAHIRLFDLLFFLSPPTRAHTWRLIEASTAHFFFHFD